MDHDPDNVRLTLYPATIAMLSRHLAAASAPAGSVRAESGHRDALIALAELAEELGTPESRRDAGPSLHDLMPVLEPPFACRGVTMTLRSAADAAPDPRQLFGLVHLLTRIADRADETPTTLTVTLTDPAGPEWAIEVVEHGVFSEQTTRGLRAEVLFTRNSALLALHGARIRLTHADISRRHWRVTALQPVAGAPGSPFGAAAPVPPVRTRHRLVAIAPLRAHLVRLKKALADTDLNQARREIQALGSLAETLDDLDLGAVGQAAAMAASHGDAAALKTQIEAFEIALVRYVLGQEAVQPPHSVDLHAPIVLVVEPELDLRTAVAECLGNDGAEVFACADPQEAASLCRGAAPDLILIAQDLAGRDGLASVCDLLASAPQRSPAVLVAVPAGGDRIAARALEAGAADVVDHPYHLPTVRHRVRRILSARREAAHAARLACVDHVTGLPNRAQFQSRLHQMLGETGAMEDGLTLVFMDLNRFKLVNETMGHDVGDRVLRGVAARLGEMMGSEGVVARLGSDEFAIVLRGVDGKQQAAVIAEALIQRISEPLRVAQHEIYTSCTLGIACCSGERETAADLMRHTDSALFHARHHGLSYALYDQSMGSRASSRLTLEVDLRRALAANQFELNFQPQIRLESGQCEGAEALVRWRHPERGLVSPAEFVPLAEDTGLIVELGYWVLEDACRFVSEVRRTHPAAALKRLSINLSPRQLDCPDLSAHVKSALARHSVSGEDLEIEITESAVMKRGDAVLTTLKALKDLGIRIAIDDFGSGYCSFGYLKRFPIDVLKIDRSLIRDIVDQSDDREIVRGIVALARALRLETVAEGVEALAEITLLRDMGCDSVQGFYFARPLSDADFTARFCADASSTGARALPQLA